MISEIMRIGIFVLLFHMGLFVNLQAQQARTISLNDAIDLALENNYQLKQARNNLELAENQVLSEKADFLPSLNASASGSKSIGRQFNETTGDFGDFTINSFGSGFSLNLPVFNTFENFNSLKSSQYSSESRLEQLQRMRETVIFQTAMAYLEVLLNTELLDIARENLKAQQNRLEQIKAQVEVGSLPTVDLYNQESTVANRELEVTNRENALNLSRIQLIRQIQVEPMDNYQFVTPEIQDIQLAPREYSLEQLVSTALENRSDIKGEQANINSIEHQLKATRGSLYPSLNLSASLSSSYNDRTREPVIDENGQPVLDPAGDPLFQTVPFNDQFFDQNISRRFSLSLSIPIFSNLNRRTSVQSQQINYKNAQLALENTRLQVVQDVQQAYNDYQSGIKRLESTKKALQAAERSYETEKQRYEVEATTFIELSTANANYVQAQSNRAQAVYNFVFRKKLLDYYLGKLGEEISLNSP